MTEDCSNCKFWEAHHDLEQGSCRRFPPVIDPLCVAEYDDYEAYDGDCSNSLLFWSSPVTSFDSWCGEWKKAKKLPEKI